MKEEATSLVADFHMGPLCLLNWNLKILVFVEGGKPENPEKNPRSKATTNNKLIPQMALGQNQAQATLVGGGEVLHHYPIPTRTGCEAA